MTSLYCKTKHEANGLCSGWSSLTVVYAHIMPGWISASEYALPAPNSRTPNRYCLLIKIHSGRTVFMTTADTSPYSVVYI